MLNIDMIDKENIKVLGLLVRRKRVELGYSLRDLGEIANISHTLISNFERGIVIPHKDTIKEIFSVLSLHFYDDIKLEEDFQEKYKMIFKHLLYYEYKKAEILFTEMDKNKHIYENSTVVVNYSLIALLYKVLTNTYKKNIDKTFQQSELIFDYYSNNQKQLFYFIKGLKYLNGELYSDARNYFEKALKIGDHKLDLIINEHYVIGLSKSNKYIDSRLTADECILEYEKQTNYIRAMRVRTSIARDFIRIKKYDHAIELYNHVLEFSIKYGVKDLENRCNSMLAVICSQREEYTNAEVFLSKVTQLKSREYISCKIHVLFNLGKIDELHEFYDEVVDIERDDPINKTKNYFEMVKLSFNKSFFDENAYEKLVKKQIEIGLISDDGEMLTLYSTFLIKHYKKERKYKKALEVSEALLHYIEFGVK